VAGLMALVLIYLLFMDFVKISIFRRFGF